MEAIDNDLRTRSIADLARAQRNGDMPSDATVKAVRERFDITDADIEEHNRERDRALHELVHRVLERTPEYDRENERMDWQAIKVRERFQCMYDAARLLDGPALESFERSVATLDRFEARLHWDSSALSVCWSSERGIFGGMIFHWRSREWGIHT